MHTNIGKDTIKKISIILMLYDIIKGNYIKMCNWNDDCKKENCLFLHPSETLNDFIHRLYDYLHGKKCDFDRPDIKKYILGNKFLVNIKIFAEKTNKKAKKNAKKIDSNGCNIWIQICDISLCDGTCGTSCWKIKIKNIKSIECPICCIKDSRGITQLDTCGHEFHKDCISKWYHSILNYRNTATCPLCRNKFTMKNCIPVYST